MKLGTIVTATDTNPLYLEFIPNFITAWNKLVPEADVHVVLISNEIPTEYMKYKDNIKLIKPIPGINTAFHAQCIRLLYPRILTRNEGVLITDMDMFPMSRRYYVDTIADHNNDSFIVYRDVCMPWGEIAMCYNIALPETWRKMFSEIDDEILIKQWYSTSNYAGTHGGSGWNTDQLILMRMFSLYQGSKLVLNDTITKFNRLDRSNNSIFTDSNRENLTHMIKTGQFDDYHCLRPYSRYKEINDYIVNCL